MKLIVYSSNRGITCSHKHCSKKTNNHSVCCCQRSKVKWQGIVDQQYPSKTATNIRDVPFVDLFLKEDPSKDTNEYRRREYQNSRNRKRIYLIGPKRETRWEYRKHHSQFYQWTMLLWNSVHINFDDPRHKNSEPQICDPSDEHSFKRCHLDRVIQILERYKKSQLKDNRYKRKRKAEILRALGCLG